MWGFASNSNPLRDRMVLAAPEVDPHRFVQRLLRTTSRSPTYRAAKQMRVPLARRPFVKIVSVTKIPFAR